MMINWSVRTKHWFLDENKKPDYHTFGKDSKGKVFAPTMKRIASPGGIQ